VAGSPARGAYVALLGIDGTGKSTLAAGLAERCVQVGQPVRTVSWRRLIESPAEPAGWPKDSLQNLWLEIFRLYYGGATLDGGARQMPGTYAELVERGGTEHLHDAALEGVRAHGPLAAALLEIAGNALLVRDSIRQWVAEGCVVIQESYGFKHVVKELLLAGELDPALAGEVALTLRYAHEFFGRACGPDVGVLVAGDPELALRWRTAEAGRTGVFENFSVAGADPAASFLALQSRCAAIFDDFAAAHGWLRVEVRDGPPAANRDRLFAALAPTPLGRLLRLSALGEPERAHR
jgi:thymidylate kinase